MSQENNTIVNLKLDELSKDLHVLSKSLEEHSKCNKADFNAVNEKIGTRVKYSTFTWILGILMVIIMGLLSLIYTKTENIDNKVEQTKNDVAFIRGTLKKTID